MNSLRRVFSFLLPYRKWLALALLATVLFTGLNLLSPLLMQKLMDDVVGPERWGLLLPITVAIFLAPALAAVVRLVNVWMAMRVGQRTIADIRMAMYEKIMSLQMQYHSEHSSGAVVARLMDDVNRIQRLLTAETVRIIVDAIVFFFSFGYVFYISWRLGLAMVVFVTLYVLGYRFFSRRIHSATTEFRDMYDQIAGRLSETIAGVRQVRIFNQETRETEVFLDRTQQSLDSELASKMGSVSLGVFCHGVSGIGSTVIVTIAAILVIQEQLTLGQLLAVNMYIWMAMKPALSLTQIVGELTETSVSVERIAEVLEEDVKVASEPEAPLLKRRQGAVEFREVCFRYEPDTPLYEGLSLKIEPGQMVALVGPTGCGKTTFTALLMRDWDVDEGAILIDGVDIRSVDLKSLRKQFGVVLQKPVLFEGTLAENIAYGRTDATREQVIEAAKVAEIYELAMDMPDGFDTVLGTEGVQLSVGERQRVSIARAVLKDPMILIMDEATSSLDSRSEMLIQRALHRVLEGRTSIVVAHRLSTIVRADKIVAMRDGTVIEEGTHEQLLKIENGLYRRLYEEMLGREEGGRA
ncbi:MAG: ABC transporter ATP-binding protein [Phycisphaerae bacterium]